MEMDGKEYFVTKPELARKMIEKISDSEWKKAKNILTVNSKVGEWVIEIYKKYGKEVANRVKIVPAGEKTKLFIKKSLNILGLDEYNILDIEDKNGNGTYDVRDFLDLDNEKIIELAGMPKGSRFSYCIMNPPYGDVGGDVTHLKFVDKCLNIVDKLVVVMPYSFVSKSNKPSDKFKGKFSEYLTTVDEVKSSLFTDTHMPNVGIYVFDKIKTTKDIIITPINRDTFKVDSLLNISKFSDYEKEIIIYLENHGQQPGITCGGHDHVTKQSLNKLGIFDNNKINELINNNIKDNCKNVPNNKVYLLVNAANGGMNGTFMSSKAGLIFTNKNDLINLLVERQTTTFSNVLLFNTIKEAENCKIALTHPLLRFTCYRTQEDQMMTIKKCYKYIPNINWEDDRVKTDEGLLEVCGCPKDKAKEYAEYCKKVIEEVDKK